MSGWTGKFQAWGQGSPDVSDAWLVLQTLPGMSPERLQKLTDALGDPLDALAASRADFTRIAGQKAGDILRQEAPGDIARRLRREAGSQGVSLLTRDNPSFPEPLRQIYAAPGALFLKGEIRRSDELGVAIVGTRNPTRYGRRIARDLAGSLAAQGVTIVSGLARGIDAEAHQAALEAGGRTIGVLGCGLGVNYPAGHEELRDRIASSGAVVTELPWEALPRPENFPRRNRLISGLSLATIVVEAALRSGALLTARLALEQGREVMAVPGPVDSSRSSGCHRILKDGAHLVESASDVLQILPAYLIGEIASRRPEFRPTGSGRNSAEFNPSAVSPPPSLSPEEKAVFELLGSGPNTVEGLTREARFAPEDVSGILLRLELQWFLHQTEGGLYERA